MKRLLSIILAILMIATSIPLVALPTFAEEGTANKKITDYKVGDTFEFGYYPQTKVTNSELIDALNDQSGSWVSYNYYIEKVQSDFMKYKDVVYNGEKYRAVTFSFYRPYYTDISSSTDNSCQDNNGYTTGNTYWFKYEPLTWKVLNPSSGLVMCTSIIDSQDYYYIDSSRTIDGKTVYANNWEYSTIRTWLNDTFYNTAFTTEQQSAISTTTIQNHAYSTDYSQYNANATRDKIYLLSYTDVQNTSYGFVSGIDDSITRQFKETDYAKSQGLYVNPYSEQASWLLRTPGYEYNERGSGMCIVNCLGSVDSHYNYVNDTDHGILPAFNFNLNSGIFQSKNCFLGNHEMVSHDGQAPACTEDGWKDYEICSICGYSTYEVIPALGHDYIKFEIDSYHTSQNIYSSKCSRCGVVNGTFIGKKITDYSKGDTFEFGYYPQTKVNDSSLISSLNSQSGSWVSYNYFISGSQSNFMKYKDVVYNGEKYRAVTFSSYRPYYAFDSSSTDYSYQDDNGYSTGNTYWFKYEPLTWKVLDPVTGLVMCTSIIDSQAYRDTYYRDEDYDYYTDSTKKYYANNYEQSTIRTWLNDTFYNTAFTEEQQSAIATTTIQNPAYSTSYSAYNANATSDKIYLLSYTDVQNTSYGFASGTGSSTTRQFKGTDYAKAQGLYVDSRYSYYRLRTAGYISYGACRVINDGIVYSYGNVSYTSIGVLPAFNFNLNSEIFQSKIHKSEVSYDVSIVYPSATQKGGTKYTCDGCGTYYITDQFESTANDLTYNFNTETGKLIISGEGALADCTATTTPWEKFKTSIKEVEIQNGVTSIGANAFNGCTNLETITIANSVTSIGISAFENTKYYNTESNWSNSILYIGNKLIKAEASATSGSVSINTNTLIIADEAFKNCVSVSRIVIPSATVTVGNNAFNGCSTMTRITIGSGVKTIGNGAFKNCSQLSNITVPNSVESVGNSAFDGCTGLNKVTINDLSTWASISFGNKTANPLYYAKSLYLNGELITELTIPDNVTTVGIQFICCESITKIIIPDTVTSIFEGAFFGCSNIEEISLPFIGDSLKKTDETYQYPLGYIFGTTCFNDSISVSQSYYGSSTTSTIITTYYIPSKLKTVNINSSVIPAGAFYNCTEITDINLSDELTSIGSNAFKNCSAVTEITIPGKLSSIGSAAFDGCTSLNKVNIANLTDWCKIEFSDSKSNPLHLAKNLYIGDELLTDLTIPEGIEKVNDYAFYGCESLNSCEISNDVESIGAGAFSGLSKLKEITIPTSVSSIGESAFNGCSNITKVNTDDLSAWSKITFGDATSNPLYYSKALYVEDSLLTELTIPDDVISLGNQYNYCDSITKVIVPETVTTIVNGAFFDCSNIEEIELPFVGDSNKSSSEKYQYPLGYVFGSSNYSGGRSTLQNYYGSSTSSVTATTYYIPSSLKKVTITGGIINYGAFYNCDKVVTIAIADSVTEIASGAFYGCNILEDLTIPFVGSSVKNSSSTYQYPLGYIFGTNSYSGGSATVQNYYGNSTSSTTSSTYYVPQTLKKVTVTGGSILYGAFQNCSNITTIILPDTDGIGGSAFNGCSKLERVVIPESVDNIGADAFKKCTSLKKVACLNKGIDTYELSVSLSDDSCIYAYNCGDNEEIAKEEGVNFIDLASFDCKNGKHVNDFYEGTVSLVPTCTELGSIVSDCIICNEKAYRDIECDENNHNFVKSEIDSYHTAKSVYNSKCSRCGVINDIFKDEIKKITDYSVGDTFEFGYYPQSEVTDSSLISSLNSQSGSWKSYNYYIESEQSDYMKYKDVAYNGEMYRAVTFSSYRPIVSSYSSSTGNSYQDDNGYTTGNTYWFKYEPLTWKVLDPSTGLVVCTSIIDSQAFRDTYYYYNSTYYTDSTKKYYANNYEQSTIRTWLNDTFFNTAFSTKQQSSISTTIIDNSAFKTDYSIYNANSTSDKIYLLSYADVQNIVYGFDSRISRQFKGTDYAKAQGLLEDSSNKYSYYRLRTAYYISSSTLGAMSSGGMSEHLIYINYSGILPAFNFNLNSEIFQPKIHKSEVSYTSNVKIVPTCTEKGTTNYTCDVCGLSYDEQNIDVLAHTLDLPKEENKVDASCTEEGSYDSVVYCSVCNAEISRENKVIDALGHTPKAAVVENRVEATCTETGSYDSVVYCSVCNAKISKDSKEMPIDLNAHDYIKTEIDSYHTTENIFAYVCSRCDAVKQTETEQVVDSYATKEVRTTFSSSGYPQSAHNYSNNYSNTWTYNAPQTCSKVEITFSSSTKTESGCDYIYIYTLGGDQIGKYSGTTLSGKTITVTGSGFKIKLTSDSSTTYYGFNFTSIVGVVQETVPATYKTVYKSHPISSGFKYNSSVKTSATCTEKGITKYTCNVCSTSFDIDINTIPHNLITKEEYTYNGEVYLTTECETCGFYEQKNITKEMTFFSNGIKYILCNKEAIIIGHDDSLGNKLIIPSTFKGYPVTTVGEESFANCLDLKEVVIPSSIKKIKFDAFDGCENIENVYISDIESWCEMEEIPYYGNPMCYAKHIYVNNQEIAELIITDGIEKISEFAFYSWKNIKSVFIPSSVVEIGLGAFYGCSNLRSIVVDDKNTIYDSRDNSNSVIETENDNLIIGCKTTEIPKTVKTIGEYSFINCDSLERISIPEGVVEIQEGAFMLCTSLKDIEISNTVKVIGEGSFVGCNIKELFIPDSVVAIGNEAFGYSSSINSIVVDEKNSIYDSRNNCNAIIDSKSNKLILGCQSTVIPNGIISLGRYSFAYCTNLKNIEIPDSVTKIERDAFYNCTGLTNVSIPCSMVEIDDNAFSNCSNLKSIIIPKSVIRIGDYAFAECPCITDVYYEGSAEEWNVIDNNGIAEEAFENVTFHYNYCYHRNKEQIPAIQATCIVDGKTAGKRCIDCGEIILSQSTIPAIEHTPSASVQENEILATCIETGSYDLVVYCSVCNAELSRESKTIEKIAHTSDTGTITTQATCTLTGIKTYKCTVCSEILKTETIGKATHTYVSVITAPTCTTEGYITRTCSNCGDSYVDAKTIALGHTSDTGTITNAATCTATGTKTYKCTVCGEVLKTETVAKIAHKNVTLKAVAATCTKDGKTAGTKCSVCGTITKKQTTVKATGHTPVTLKAVTPTAKKSGLTAGSKCSVCGTILKAQTITLAQVTSLKASKQSTSGLTLTWSKINGAKYYKVEQSTDGKKWTIVKTVTTNSLAVTKLKAGTTYQYRVTALDSTKKIAGKVSAVLKATTLCSAPNIKLTSTKKATATVTITKVTGAKSYVIYTSTDNKKWTKATTTTKTTHTLTKLTAGKKIYVKVVAVNADKANSAYSKTVNATVKK